MPFSGGLSALGGRERDSPLGLLSSVGARERDSPLELLSPMGGFERDRPRESPSSARVNFSVFRIGLFCNNKGVSP